MIRSFGCRKTALFFEERKTRSFPPDIQRIALRKLAQVHAVTELIHLREDFLIPLGLSEYRLAKDIGVPPRRINEIVKGTRALTVDTALRLERYFDWPAEVWLNLQSHHDQQTAKISLKSTLAGIHRCPAL